MSEEQKVNSNPISQNTVLAGLAYIGPLVVISYILGKDVPFVKFHIKQGMVLLVIEVAVWLLGSLLYFVWPIVSLVINLVIIGLSIYGILNVVKNQEKELPVIGKFSKYFSF